MKQIDKLLIRSFIPSFVLTFFIALFVLIMQFLWLHIDDIIGKGASMAIVSELFFYLSISLIPLALPIAVLIASVMVMGNLAERHELASIISAGVPLSRILRPLMYVAGAITIGSFLCSNYLIPLANLQYKTRLQDIRNQKMALNLETGVFNDDFKNYVIHIGKKDTENNRIEDIIIYDYSSKGTEPMQILANKGEMHVSSNGKYLIMKLYKGTQIQASQQIGNTQTDGHPFSRTSFKQWNKVFDLSEFDLNLSDTEKYDKHYAMLSVLQLQNGIDSLTKKIDYQLERFSNYTNDYINYALYSQSNDTPDSIKNKLNIPPTSTIKTKHPTKQNIDKPLAAYSSIHHTFSNDEVQKSFISKAKSDARNLQNKAKSTAHALQLKNNKKIKHVYELNIKFSLAVICFIFLFIGAPMGAIIRKGGFGYPVLIAILFFMLYIVLNVLCKKLAEGAFIPAEYAAWIPCAILLPVGLFLTFRAMYDKGFTIPLLSFRRM